MVGSALGTAVPIQGLLQIYIQNKHCLEAKKIVESLRKCMKQGGQDTVIPST